MSPIAYTTLAVAITSNGRGNTRRIVASRGSSNHRSKRISCRIVPASNILDGKSSSDSTTLCPHTPFSLYLSDHSHATATCPPTGRSADKFEPGSPWHDDDGAAVFRADGPDTPAGVGFVEGHGTRRRGVNLDGEGEGIPRRVDFLIRGVDGPFWREAFLVCLGETCKCEKNFWGKLGRQTSFWHLRTRFSVDVDVSGLGSGMVKGIYQVCLRRNIKMFLV